MAQRRSFAAEWLLGDVPDGIVNALRHVVDVLGGEAADVDAAARQQVNVVLLSQELHLLS